jgi:hypothetical protein
MAGSRRRPQVVCGGHAFTRHAGLISTEEANHCQHDRGRSAAVGEAQVHPGHVLLALLREDAASSSRGSAAIKMLQEQGVDVDWLRNRAMELMESR